MSTYTSLYHHEENYDRYVNLLTFEVVAPFTMHYCSPSARIVLHRLFKRGWGGVFAIL